MKRTLILTDDGSHSIYFQEFDENYHSKKGALNESKHVFIANGLSQITKTEINILEIGFGTGLNALLSYIYGIEYKIKINYFTIEKYPLENDIYKQLNYPELLNADPKIFLKLHQSSWNKNISISEYFDFTKFETDFIEFNLKELNQSFDLVYFDAFSFSKQEKMWSLLQMEKLYQQMNSDALLVTYASAGSIKIALRDAGFIIKRLPGASGKFHMLQAKKI